MENSIPSESKWKLSDSHFKKESMLDMLNLRYGFRGERHHGPNPVQMHHSTNK